MVHDNGYGFGSVYQRVSDGRWCAAVQLPRVRGEKRRRKVFTATTKQAVVDMLEDYRREVTAPQFAGRAINVKRARKLGSHTDREWWALVRSVERRCFYCHVEVNIYTVAGARRTPLDLQRDHKIPLSRGGSDAIDNVAVSCRACNAEKGTMTADEYAEWKQARQ